MIRPQLVGRLSLLNHLYLCPCLCLWLRGSRWKTSQMWKIARLSSLPWGKWLDLSRVQSLSFPVLKAAMAARMYPSAYPRLQDAIMESNGGKHKSSTMAYYAKLNRVIARVGGLAALQDAVASERAWRAINVA